MPIDRYFHLEPASFLHRRAFQKKIAVLDDFYPNRLSAFRYEEFNFYLRTMPRVEIHSTGAALHLVNETRPIADIIRTHQREHAPARGRVHKLNTQRFPNAAAYYAVFLNNIFPHIDAIEARRAPFAFTLYPGGGLQLDDPLSDHKLTRVMRSPFFRKVITTQRITTEYLLKKQFCAADQIEFIFGCVMPPPIIAPRRGGGGLDQAAIHVAFTANKYTPQGADKGYDLFISVATALAGKHENVFFHVVGGFDDSILDVRALRDRITFHGLRDIAFFNDFYAGIDIFVAPNRPNVLSQGGFDGFPTAAAADAMLRGVALVCTDPLGLNVAFDADEDLVLVEPTHQSVFDAVDALIADPQRLARIARSGQAKAATLYGAEAQLKPRAAMLDALRAARL